MELAILWLSFKSTLTVIDILLRGVLQTLRALQCSHNSSKRASLLFAIHFPSSESCDPDGNKKVNLDEWISCLVDGSETWYGDFI